jgi:hypothetical protein
MPGWSSQTARIESQLRTLTRIDACLHTRIGVDDDTVLRNHSIHSIQTSGSSQASDCIGVDRVYLHANEWMQNTVFTQLNQLTQQYAEYAY